MSAPEREGCVIDETEAAAVVQATVRSLLRVRDPEEAMDALFEAVRRFGGKVAGADDAPADAAIPVDLSFGLGPPMLPVAPLGSEARQWLERHLPQLVEDTRTAISGLHTSRMLSRDASTDPLTGLLNRRALGRILARMGPPHAVIVFDLDHFKRANDEHGHAMGDRVLVAFAEALRRSVRQADHVGRHGGEEFVVLLDGADQAGVDAALARLSKVWEEIRPLPVTFSAGVALLAGGEAGPSAVRRADEAMFEAKRSGRDRVRFAAPPEPTGGAR